MKNLFLQPIKVKRFVKIEKLEDVGQNLITNHRILRFVENKKPDDIYYVIGTKLIKEGHTEKLGSNRLFIPRRCTKVYIVAKSLGRQFKVLESDLVNQNIGVDLASGNDWTVVK